MIQYIILGEVNFMKVLSKRLALVVLAAMVVSTVSGCGKSESSASTESKSTSSYEPKADKKYKISFFNSQAFPVDADGAMVKYWNEKFNVEFNIINLDPKTVAEQMNLKIASGEIPDIMGLGNAALTDYQRQGALASIPEDVMKKYLPNVLAELEVESPGITKYGVIDGKRYGIASSMFMYNSLRRPIVYNGQWMKKVGVDKAPETFQDFEKLMYKFANEDPDGDGKKNTYGLSNTAIPMVYNAFSLDRGVWIDKDGKAAYGSIQPGMKDALTVLNKWYKDKVLDPEFITGENTGGYWALTQAFINGRIGLTNMGSFYHWSPELPGRAEGQDSVEVGKKSPEMKANLVFGKAVTGNDGKVAVYTAPVARDSFFAIGAPVEKEPDKLAKILQIAESLCGSFTEDTYVTYMHGKKGTDWERAADGSVKMISTNEQIIKKGGWGTFHFFSLAKNQLLVEQPLMDWGKKNGFEQGRAQTIKPDFVQFESWKKYSTELNKIENEAYIKMITGEKPISYFDDFVKEWNAAGGDKVVQEANDWYSKNKTK
jgi:putative aldouronate transport system substrate-binding protein